MKYSTHHCYR